MSNLRTVENIKIPYPTEGVIRTAQLDDTVAPENSVQLAVNMNFDRVGAIQTRPGVAQYADDLVGAITNYGTLRNAIIPAGFEFIFQLGVTQDLSPLGMTYVSALKISDTKIAAFWTGPDGKGYCRNFSIDLDTGSMTPLGVAVNFDSTGAIENKATILNSTLVVNVWQQGSGDPCFGQVFDVSQETIVPKDTAYQIESVGFNFGTAVVDSNHIILFYCITGGDLIAVILEINLTTFAITEPGATLNAGGSTVLYNSTVRIDGTHFLNMWTDATVPKAQVFSVNTGTWAISAVGSALSLSGSSRNNQLVAFGDSDHFIAFYESGGVFLKAQALEVDLGTFAVTAVGTPFPDGTIMTGGLSVASLGTSGYFTVFYALTSGQGKVQMMFVNAGDWSIATIANTITGFDFGDPMSLSALALATNEVGVIWGGVDSEIGQGAMFKPYGDVVEGRFLYAGHGSTVSNRTTGAWTSRRTSLQTFSKPRFSQYLNYIWMVNGNAQLGGDPVATSNGGAFGTDLVPENFPPGDFIHAGFEGRVWVANKTLGVIYYTDIVQFVPPATYILTYNPGVNFISQISPQTGQTITGLFRVPRALLVFTEDTIMRIYGASSVDAYPAYNVGTYSQESIIETKTGIFFHHSSGFYQFDYGSQPVEISRRIIDFVKAIPRANYDDVVGVWDGFDNVEWSVGQVTVEGVVFSNCYVRYTISTQVWTIYDYAFTTGALILYDDGTTLNHLVGTSTGKTGALDSGTTDFGNSFYYEFIDRWRGYTNMYYQTKAASGFNVYSENAAGANLSYQKQKSGPNAWIPLGTVTEANNAILPNSNTEDFDVMRLRLAGNTLGAQVVVHGIEITQLTIKGQETN